MKIGVVGCTGKMGNEVIKEILNNKAFELAAGSTDENNDSLGKDLGTIIGSDPIGIAITSNPLELINKAEIIIDFTNTSTSIDYAKLCSQHKKKLVCGTTGFSDKELKILTELAKDTPIFWSPNMSIGVNLLKKLAYISAKILGEDFDVEILEMHHNKKIDAPSGTAILLGKEIAKALDAPFQEKAKYNRESGSSRAKGEIGFAVLRGGDIVGDHSILFAGAGEMITLSHRATNRSLFAKGAVKAALWLKNKQAGKLYNMDDMLA